MSTVESPELSYLRRFILNHCLFFGDYTLSSGQKSDVYLDLRKLTLFGPSLLVASLELLRLSHDIQPEAQAVGGMASGASPLAVNMAMQSYESGGSIKQATIAYKEGATVQIANPQSADTTILLVDDVISTAKATAAAAHAFNRRISGAVCLVDRQMGGRELLEQTFGIPVLSLFTLSNLIENR